MYEKYNVDVNSLESTNLRSLLYNFMKDISNNQHLAHHDLKTLNNITLTKLHDYYLKTYSITQTRKPNLRTLDREHAAIGPRKNIAASIPMPVNTYEDQNNITDDKFTRFVDMRKNEHDHNPEQRRELTMPQITDHPISEDDMKRRLEMAQRDRNTYAYDTVMLTQHQVNDPVNFQKSLPIERSNDTINLRTSVSKTTYHDVSQNQNIPNFTNHAIDTLMRQPVSHTSSSFLTLNGYDRDWVMQKKRFHFSIETDDMLKRYKNIVEIAATRMIIPSEIIAERTIDNPTPKSQFEHSYRMAYPYIVLKIEELSDVCDGIAQTNQQAFTHFIQDCTYSCVNGRGYTILKPMQDERKVFHPTPLASLPRLTMSVLKPNGNLFNHSQDKNTIWKIEYADYNKKFVKVVLTSFFDKNEFYKGDVVRFKDFEMPVFDRDDEDLEDNPAYTDYTLNSFVYNKIMDFVNRKEGHEILEIGTPNDEGSYRHFVIKAPGEYDSGNGRFVIDKAMVDLIKHYNEQNFIQVTTPTGTGHVINMTLQPVISFRIGSLVGNATPSINPMLV